MQYIAFDAHKHYTRASVEHPTGGVVREVRLAHRRGVIQDFLAQCAPGSPVAVETMGNWYWLVDEIEAAGMVPQLVHARKAKLMLGMINKTDKLDARGLNRLQRTGTLSTVWIPPAEVRDQRDLPRTRMVLARERTRLKNRIHATLAKYALSIPDVSDLFGARGRALLPPQLGQLPPHTCFATERLLEQLEEVAAQIAQFEHRMRQEGLAPVMPPHAARMRIGFHGAGYSIHGKGFPAGRRERPHDALDHRHRSQGGSAATWTSRHSIGPGWRGAPRPARTERNGGGGWSGRSAYRSRCCGRSCGP
jgi:transposase